MNIKNLTMPKVYIQNQIKRQKKEDLLVSNLEKPKHF